MPPVPSTVNPRELKSRTIPASTSARGNAMTRRRREFLRGSAAAVVAAGGLPVPAIAQGIRELKLVTDWTEGLAGLDTGSQRFARSVTAMSDGRLKVTVYPSGKLVRPLETFDAVSSGIADMYHSFDPYFES